MSPRRLTPRTSLVATLVALLAAGALALPLVAVAAGPDPLPRPAPAAKVRAEDRLFKVGTLNILGSNHTRGGDKKRTFRTARLIRKQKLKVLAMQEVQDDQLRWLRKKLPRYRIWPGKRYGGQGLRLQIAWRKARFDLVDHGSIETTFSGFERPVPWVRLKEERTGRRFFVIDVHNSPRDQEADRDSATRKQLRLYNRLRERGGPVMILGDANERREWFCKVTRRTDARAANGGRTTDKRCTPPRPTYIDWIMGGGRLGWRDYDARRVEVSDHPLHTAVARLRKRR
ncbi:endonuclease/exonuclease/phosphatase family protein [Nocardioides coralli]|uniref:endonuclease/exonuclease/phosphatase family protein n=1 Tax=Nocardioides coralli TaxID=2872154 RepID=UPI001CA43649|nr:endonuclease/exonuclease/phosphatase family protein [Nocardioides coralli]QZY28536.1 endonuclease/exonuclease/phosphatase family protein [Nocardioides coralli]